VLSLSHPMTTGELFLLDNRLDAFVEAVRLRAAAWLPRSALAASSVTVTVDGKPVALQGGRFDVRVGPGPHTVVATDGSGGSTGLVLTA